MLGHRSNSCNHYDRFLYHVEENDYEDMFYLVKDRGRNPSRTTAFYRLQVDPNTAPFVPDWEHCPRCPMDPCQYSFRCQEPCCADNSCLVVKSFVSLRVCHTELDMKALTWVDPIPLAGSRVYRAAYRKWQLQSSDAKTLDLWDKMDHMRSSGSEIDDAVLKESGFDAQGLVATMVQKTITKFGEERVKWSTGKSDEYRANWWREQAQTKVSRFGLGYDPDATPIPVAPAAALPAAALPAPVSGKTEKPKTKTSKINKVSKSKVTQPKTLHRKYRIIGKTKYVGPEPESLDYDGSLEEDEDIPSEQPGGESNDSYTLYTAGNTPPSAVYIPAGKHPPSSHTEPGKISGKYFPGHYPENGRSPLWPNYSQDVSDVESDDDSEDLPQDETAVVVGEPDRSGGPGHSERDLVFDEEAAASNYEPEATPKSPVWEHHAHDPKTHVQEAVSNMFDQRLEQNAVLNDPNEEEGESAFNYAMLEEGWAPQNYLGEMIQEARVRQLFAHR